MLSLMHLLWPQGGVGVKARRAAPESPGASDMTRCTGVTPHSLCPEPLATTGCFLSLWTCQLWTCPLRRITRCVAFGIWLLSWSTMFPWWRVSVPLSFPWLCNRPVGRCTTLCLSRHPFRDISSVSASWLLRIMP